MMHTDFAKLCRQKTQSKRVFVVVATGSAPRSAHACASQPLLEGVYKGPLFRLCHAICSSQLLSSLSIKNEGCVRSCRRRRGCRYGPGSPQTPPFLEGASPAVVSEFNTLLAGAHGQTDAQLEGKVDAWVAEQSKDIQDKFAVFKVEYKKQQAAAEAAHAQAISKFSPEAKAADARLSEVANKHTLTVKEKGEQIEAIMASLPENVRNEIQKAMAGQ